MKSIFSNLTKPWSVPIYCYLLPLWLEIDYETL